MARRRSFALRSVACMAYGTTSHPRHSPPLESLKFRSPIAPRRLKGTFTDAGCVPKCRLIQTLGAGSKQLFCHDLRVLTGMYWTPPKATRRRSAPSPAAPLDGDALLAPRDNRPRP